MNLLLLYRSSLIHKADWRPQASLSDDQGSLHIGVNETEARLGQSTSIPNKSYSKHLLV